MWVRGGRIAASRRTGGAAAAITCALLGATGCTGIKGFARAVNADVRFIAFGDSATAGPSERDYPDALREQLGEPAAVFVNEGRGGETTGEGLKRLRDLIQKGIYPNARFLLYWEGGNNVNHFIAEHDALLIASPGDEHYPLSHDLARELDKIEDDVRAAIEAARNAHLTVLVATYYLMSEDLDACEATPPGALTRDQARRANDYIRLLNRRLRTAASDAGAVLVDVESLDGLLRGERGNYYNCNHLAARGNEIVGGLFAERVQQTGNQR
ncbi:MAG: GDSL-type esterase/lipase family protein [Phycisphaerae bacterium]